MARRIRTSVGVWVCVLALVVSPPPAMTCGPFFAKVIFSFSLHPDFPLTRFAGGELGIVQSTYARSYLIVAYRYMTGKPLDKAEQESVAALWRRRFAHSLFADDAHPDPAAEWLAARRKYMGGKDAAYIDRYRKATRTLNQRATQFGPNSAALKSWIAAQDLVFSHCGNPSEKAEPGLPESISPSVPTLLKADRDYQVAAIHFYSGDYVTSEKEFSAIAQDGNSPWQVSAALLIARSRIRKATLQDSDKLAAVDMRAAEDQLLQVLKSPKYREVHPAAHRLL